MVIHLRLRHLEALQVLAEFLGSVSDTLEALQVLAEFPKFLISVCDTLKGLPVRAEFLKFPTYVFDFSKALYFLAEFVKSFAFVLGSFGTSVLFSIMYKISTMLCSLNSLLASGGAVRPH